MSSPRHLQLDEAKTVMALTYARYIKRNILLQPLFRRLQIVASLAVAKHCLIAAPAAQAHAGHHDQEVVASAGSAAPFVGLFGTVWGIYTRWCRLA